MFSSKKTDKILIVKCAVFSVSFVLFIYRRVCRRRMSQNQTKPALIALSFSVTSFLSSVKKAKLLLR